MLLFFVEKADAPSQVQISITVTIRSENFLTGVVEYKNMSERMGEIGSLLPLEDARVELWATPEQYEIAEDYTDDNNLDELYFTESKDESENVYSGYFSFPPFDGTADIMIWAEDSEDSVVVEHQLENTSRKNQISDLEKVYCYIYPDVTCQLGFVEVKITDGDTSGAFNIYSAITRASRRLEALTENEEIEETSYHAPKVTVRWSKGCHHQTEYDAISDTIFVDSTEEVEDAYNTDSILHQYGHFIEDQITADWQAGTAYDWSEGLATFMAAALLTDEHTPIESLDEVYGVVLESNDNYGELDEANKHWAVTQSLYDILDGNEDGGEDSLQLPFSYIFKVVDEKDSHTVSEFWDHWFGTYGTYPHEGYPFEMAALYELHGIEHEGLLVQASSPVDMLITGISGLQIGKDVDEMPAAKYREVDLDGDGNSDHDMLFIALSSPNPYLYSIAVIPEPGASPTDTYWLEVILCHQTLSLATEVQIQDIPQEPYAFMSAHIALYPERWDIQWLNKPAGNADKEDRKGMITCYIGNLPTGFDVEQILPETILLNNIVPVATDKQGKLLAKIKKHREGFTASVLEVKFSKLDTISSIGSVTAGEEALVTVAGNVEGETKTFMAKTKVLIVTEEKEKSGGKKILAAPKKVALLSNSLSQNYPNPFNAETWIPFTLSNGSSQVVIKIYSMSGQLVETLNLGDKPAGAYVSKDRAAYWDGKNRRGEEVSSGVYFYTIHAGSFTATRKMLIIR